METQDGTLPRGNRPAPRTPTDPLADLNAITSEILNAALKVHSRFGPGLLERVYRDALAKELSRRGRAVGVEVPLLVEYEGEPLGEAYRLDLLVEEQVVVEVKSTHENHPVYAAQLLTYLRCGNKPVGLLLNFGHARLMDGVRRMINSAALGEPT